MGESVWHMNGDLADHEYTSEKHRYYGGPECQ